MLSTAVNDLNSKVRLASFRLWLSRLRPMCHWACDIKLPSELILSAVKRG